MGYKVELNLKVAASPEKVETGIHGGQIGNGGLARVRVANIVA